jgi:hypothetical protein
LLNEHHIATAIEKTRKNTDTNKQTPSPNTPKHPHHTKTKQQKTKKRQKHIGTTVFGEHCYAPSLCPEWNINDTMYRYIIVRDGTKGEKYISGVPLLR